MLADTGLIYSPPDWRRTLKSFHRIKNNQSKLSMKPYPDVKLLAVFAKLAYSDCSEEKPAGWYLLTTAQNHNNGYFGCAVWNPSQQQVVIAHRGTDLKNLGAIWIDGIGVACNQYSGHMSSAISFADEMKKIILQINRKHGSRFVMSLTGHSLGAWLAGVTTLTVKHLKREGSGFCKIANLGDGLHAHTLALDSPGVEDMLIKISRDYDVRYDPSMCTKQLDITTYFAAPNLVNSTGYHVGSLLQIPPERVTLASDSKEPTMFCNIGTHSIDIFMKAFDDGKDTYAVLNWPQGWSERKYYHELEKLCNSYILNLDAVQATPESSGGSCQNPQPVEGNYKGTSEDASILRYKIISSLGTSCHLGVFSTEEFNYIEKWSFFQSNPLIERTKINEFTTNQQLDVIDLPNFKINTRRNTITCKSREDLGIVVEKTKQLMRWFPGIMKALVEQGESIQIAPLFWASQAYLRTLPFILDCEDTFGMKSFLESSEQRALQLIVTSDFEFEAARLYNIITINSSLDTRYSEENSLILSRNDLPKVRLQGLKETSVTRNILLILNFPLSIGDNYINKHCDEELMRCILSNLGSNTKLVIVRSQPFDSQLFEDYKLTFEIKTLEPFQLNDLTPTSRDDILSRDAVTIGDKTLSLDILLGNNYKSPNEDLQNKINQIISDILKNLATENHCVEKIPNNLPRLCELDALYSKGYKRVDKAKLTALLERTGADGPLLVIGDAEQLSQGYWEKMPETARGRIFTSVANGHDLFLEKCREEPARLIYWFIFSAEGFTLNEVYNINVYLPRRFNSRFIIKSLDEFVQYRGDKDLFIFNNIEDKTSLIHTFGLSGEAGNLLVKNYHFKIRSPSRRMSEADKKREDSFSKHYLNLLEIGGSPYLVWQYSEGSLDGLRPFITRDNKNPIEEGDFCIRMKKLTIIADDPGMGKTTSLTRMSELIQNSWVLRIDHTLLDSASAKLPLKLDLQSVTIFLLRVSGLPTDIKWVSSLFQLCLESEYSRQVCVLVDAFDEINDENVRSKIIEILKFLKTATTCQTVVTTRVHQQKLLEKDLEEFAVELEKIKEEEQQDYLVNSWLPHLALELLEHSELENGRLLQFASDLRNEVKEVLSEDVTSFMGIPLQIRMLAEVFLQQAIQPAVSPEQTQNLGKITNLFDLYKQFIEVKKKIYFEQKTNIIKLKPYQLKAVVKDMMEKHCHLAFRATVPSFATQYFANSQLSVEELKELSSLGLIKYKIDGNFHFVHRTFQEYFCADFFVQWFRLRSDREKKNILIKNEISKFLLRPGYKIIRMFIETQLEISPIAGDDQKNHPVLYQHWWEHRQLLFHDDYKTPLHIAAEEQNRHTVALLLSGPTSRTSEEAYVFFIAARDKYRRTVLNIALEKGNTNIENLITEVVKSCLYESILRLMLATFFTGFFTEGDSEDGLINHGSDKNVAKGNDSNGVDVHRFLYESDGCDSYSIDSKRNTTNKNDIDSKRNTTNRNDIASKRNTINRNDIDNKRNTTNRNDIDSEKNTTNINDLDSKRNTTNKKDIDSKRNTINRNDIDSKKNTTNRNDLDSKRNTTNKKDIDSKRNTTNRNDIDRKEEIYLLTFISKSQKFTSVHRALKRTHQIRKDIFKPFITAVRADDYETVLEIFSGMDNDTERAYLLIAIDHQGYTAINIATEERSHMLFKLFAQHGVGVSCDIYGWSPLHYAAQGGYISITNFLLYQSEETYECTLPKIGRTFKLKNVSSSNYQDIMDHINSVDIWDQTALMLAARGGHSEVVRMLLDSGADISANRNGKNALMLAAERGHLEVVRSLLDSGADVMSADSDGNTALILTAWRGHAKVVRLLLESRADMMSANSDVYTALMLAADEGHPEVVRLLLEAGSKMSSVYRNVYAALLLATLGGRHEVVRMLIESGAHINFANTGYTDLMLAIDSGNHNEVRILLEAGAGIDTSNRTGNTALMWAAKNGHCEMARMLLESRADTSSENINGETALMLAADGGHSGVVRLLLQSRADTSSANSYAETALMLAAERGHAEVVSLLLESGADTSSANSDSRTALMLAAHAGNHEVVRMLLDSGADINTRNIWGETALYLAFRRVHVRVVEVLLKYNPKVSPKDMDDGGREGKRVEFYEITDHQEFVDLIRRHQETTPDDSL